MEGAKPVWTSLAVRMACELKRGCVMIQQEKKGEKEGGVREEMKEEEEEGKKRRGKRRRKRRRRRGVRGGGRGRPGSGENMAQAKDLRLQKD